MILAQNITKSFGLLQVLKGIDLDIQKGEIVTIAGASGAGKTTLLQILGTLQRQDSGTVEINGIDINKLSDRQLSKFRNRHIGFVFQFHHLLPEFTAIENVCIPAFLAGISKNSAMEKAGSILNMLNLNQKFNSKPNELSGGENQRVAIARALINDPSVILADEPSGNLDSKNTLELYELIASLREKLNQTFIIVTHNLKLAQMSDRMLTIQDGKISQD
ncbi:MAG: ABC transporter ATP-binding protein [Bacteroidia bacterium]|nr:ABC transporter ATP-binding protein [Bacteroidia bacterium]